MIPVSSTEAIETMMYMMCMMVVTMEYVEVEYDIEKMPRTSMTTDHTTIVGGRMTTSLDRLDSSAKDKGWIMTESAFLV